MCKGHDGLSKDQIRVVIPYSNESKGSIVTGYEVRVRNLSKSYDRATGAIDSATSIGSMFQEAPNDNVAMTTTVAKVELDNIINDFKTSRIALHDKVKQLRVQLNGGAAFVEKSGLWDELAEGKIMDLFITGDGAAGDFFGGSVAMSSDGARVVVGAYADDDAGSVS